MKRYLVFAGDIYYAAGGMDDFINDFDERDSATACAVEAIHSGAGSRWAHVYDCVERKFIWENGKAY